MSRKVFISQPMNNKTDEEILSEREKAIELVKEKLGEDIQVIDSFLKSYPPDARPLWFLGKSLELLSYADVVYFAKGWQEARGCKLEYICALEYETEILVDDEVEQ